VDNESCQARKTEMERRLLGSYYAYCKIQEVSLKQDDTIVSDVGGRKCREKLNELPTATG